MILAYASNHRSLYEDTQPSNFRCPPKPYSGSHSARPVATGGNYHPHHPHHHPQTTNSGNNAALNSLKSRICGYDAKTFEFHNVSHAYPLKEGEILETVNEHQQLQKNENQDQFPTSKSFEGVSSTCTCGPVPTYLQEDFNYQDRLKALMKNNQNLKNNSNSSARISSTTTTESPPNEGDKEGQSELPEKVQKSIPKSESSLQTSQTIQKSEKIPFDYPKPSTKSLKNFHSVKKRSQSLHHSLEHLSSFYPTTQEMINLASLKTTNSDSRLAMVREPKVLRVLFERQQHNQLSVDIDDSVFEAVVDLDDGKSSFFLSPSEDDDEDDDDLTSDLVIASEEDEDVTEDFDDDVGTVSSTMKHHHVPPRNRILGRSSNLIFGGLTSVEADSDATLRHFERALAHIFLRKLKTLLPELVGCRNSMLVDDCIQAFASGYCKGKN